MNAATTRRLPTAERREQLADAALSLLSREGAPALTVRRIAQAVGITDGAVFRHFKGKEELLDAAVERFESRLTALPSPEGAPRARLQQFFVERTRAVQAQPEILGLALSDRLQEVVGARSAKRLQRVMKTSFEFVVACLVEAQAGGHMVDIAEPRVAAWMVTGAMRGAARAGVDPQAAWNDVERLLFVKTTTAKRPAKPSRRRRKKT